MSEPWFLLASGLSASADNMAWDEALLEAVVRLGHPVLRFYGWLEPAATFGYSQTYNDVARWTSLRPLIRRPTGGGLVPHDADWTYSLVFPPGCAWYALKATESYKRVHDWIGAAFAKLGVTTQLSPSSQKDLPGQCFAGAEQFDLLCNARKVAGAAQRRNRLGLLIQGSVQPPSTRMTRQDWERAMCATVPGRAPVEWRELHPDRVLKDMVKELVRSKYSQDAHNCRR